MADQRFVNVYTQGNGITSAQIEVFVDTVTGVNYIFRHDGYAGGLTPLIDPDGKPVVTVIDKKN